MNIVPAFLKKNPYYEKNAARQDSRYADFQKNGPKGLMLHSVGCPQPSAMVFVNNWNEPTFDAACVHAFIDANDGTVHQTMPWNFRAPHCGGDANNTHIGIEMCEPGCIRYTSGSQFTCSNLAAARTAVKRTYDSAVELFAMLCEKYSLNPMQPGVIISHKEGHTLGIASNHGDPEHLWTQLGLPYTMDTFRADVQKKLLKTEGIDMTQEELQQTIQKALEADRNARTYDTLEAVPEWGRAAVEKLVASGALKGTGEGKLDISYDLLRTLVILDRLGVI